MLSRRHFLARTAQLALTGVASEVIGSGVAGSLDSDSLRSARRGVDVFRPFYIIGHDPNRISDVVEYIERGANAIEPDVNVYKHDPTTLCVDHGPDIGGPGSDTAPSLVQYLTELREVAIRYPQLALVYFDCKPLAATAVHGQTLLHTIRTCLIGDGEDRIPLSVIISVAKLDDVEIFQNIRTQFRPREAAMIDQENDPLEVSDFFTALAISNQCFSNGISVANCASPLFAPHVRPSIEQACALRASHGAIRFVATWTVNDPQAMARYIAMGVDGMIVDTSPPFYNPGVGISALTSLMEHDGERLGVRKAVRSDDPFAAA